MDLFYLRMTSQFLRVHESNDTVCHYDSEDGFDGNNYSFVDPDGMHYFFDLYQNIGNKIELT